jgi:RNA polymerase sigma-70 factor (ECF subfamily)
MAMGSQHEAPPTSDSAQPAKAPAGDHDVVVVALRDPAAFSILFDRYWDQVFRFCYYRLGDWHDAEDAASQVFVNAFGGIERFRNDDRDDAFRCWLFTIARSVVSNSRRWHARHQTTELDAAAELIGSEASPEELAIANENQAWLRSLLLTLNDEQRDLLELRLSGLTDAEIARVLGRSHDAVRKAQSRAVQALRAQVDAMTLEGGAR